jgi:alkanesulfonate monooxygenase SsuD/methylene tetrahydromethanopterin reductase-like flavin-dependent oxidoreductase (luciferase family)
VEISGLKIGVRLPSRVDQPGEYLADAAAFDAAGADALWLGEGVFRPASADAAEPDMTHEPWTLLAAIAAVTHRATIGTAVSVAAMWPPALFAAAVTTLDHISRGRVVIGLGAGWEAAQFEAVGLGFDDRGKRLDEFMEAVRHLWSDPGQPFQGRFYRLPPLRLAAPFRPGGPPVLIGAIGDSGYRRAALHADGFIHVERPPEQMAATLTRLRELRAAAGREGPFELWALVSSPESRDEWRGTLEAQAAAGATGVIVPAGPRLLDVLRNPDQEGDRSDLHLAQG